MSRMSTNAAWSVARLVATLCRFGLGMLPMLWVAVAEAETLPRHGVFGVQSGIGPDRMRYCQLTATSEIEGSLFELTLRWSPSGRLQAWFVSGEEGVAEAEQVSVAVDGTRMFRFKAVKHGYEGGLSRLSSEVMRREVGLPIEAMLTDAAEHAEWLRVSAFYYEEAVPATGLKEALEDLRVCRKSNDV